jgi:predicted Zn-dependent peptidase
MYERYSLSNGIKIITEYIPYVNSISIGVWIKSGSRYETPENNGVSHFIEHMLFKGTKSELQKR